MKSKCVGNFLGKLLKSFNCLGSTLAWLKSFDLRNEKTVSGNIFNGQIRKCPFEKPRKSLVVAISRDPITSMIWDWWIYIWAVLKRSFISQGRKELLTPPLTRPQCQLTHGDSTILLTCQLMRTYASQGVADAHILMTTSLLTTWRGTL